MKCLLLIAVLFTSTSYAKEYIVKKKKNEVKITLELSKEYEAKETFLSTPLLIWNKKLKHHGPSIGIFPIGSDSKERVSIKAKVSNFDKFKKENTINLKSLKATSIKFGEPKFSKDQVTYTLRYKLPGNIEVFSSETVLMCFSKGLQIKSVVKSVDYKKFKSEIDRIIKSIKCVKN